MKHIEKFMTDQERWDELHAERLDKLADGCDNMAREWASKHGIHEYQMAAQILMQKEVYKRMAYSMRQPRFLREEMQALEGFSDG